MLRVAIDFDGTIVENCFPQIGKPKLFAFETLKALQDKGILLILWTVRSGSLLDQAVEFCRTNGVEFYAVNKNHPDELVEPDTPRKLDVDIYVDDRNVGGFIGWGEVWNSITNEKIDSDMLEKYAQKRKFRGLRSIFHK